MLRVRLDTDDAGDCRVVLPGAHRDVIAISGGGNPKSGNPNTTEP